VGYDAGKRVKGRKVHALVDTEGLPLRVIVHSAGLQDRDGGVLVLDRIRQRFNWLELIWADAGYNARQVEAAVAKQPPLRVEIVKRSDDVRGFVVLPRRWVVERSFSWFGRNRRLAKDYENLADTLAAFITLACIRLALKRLARTQTFESGSKPRKTPVWFAMREDRPLFVVRLRGPVDFLARRKRPEGRARRGQA
jgi:transposase